MRFIPPITTLPCKFMSTACSEVTSPRDATGALMGDVRKYVSSWMGDTDPQVDAHPVHFPNVVVMDVSDGAFPSQPGAPAEDKIINM